MFDLDLGVIVRVLAPLVGVPLECPDSVGGSDEPGAGHSREDSDVAVHFARLCSLDALLGRQDDPYLGCLDWDGFGGTEQ